MDKVVWGSGSIIGVCFFRPIFVVRKEVREVRSVDINPSLSLRLRRILNLLFPSISDTLSIAPALEDCIPSNRLTALDNGASLEVFLELPKVR